MGAKREKIEKQILKRKLHQTTSNTSVKEYNKRHHHIERERICITDYSPIEYEELVFLQGSDFEKIFGYPDGHPKLKRLLPVVKVTNLNTRKSVHLLYRTSSEIRGYRDYAVMTFSAIKKISSNPEELHHMKYVEISKGRCICFYLHHPIHTVRWSLYLGITSIVIGLISFLVALIPCCH